MSASNPSGGPQGFYMESGVYESRKGPFRVVGPQGYQRGSERVPLDPMSYHRCLTWVRVDLLVPWVPFAMALCAALMVVWTAV